MWKRILSCDGKFLNFSCSNFLKCPIFPIWFWNWEKWGISKNEHLINLKTENEPKMKFVDFGAFQKIEKKGLFSRIQLSQGKPAVIEKFVFWILWDSISFVKISMSNQKFYIVSKLCNWLLKGKYSYSQSEYELFMGKKEAPLLDTDL